MEAKTTLMNGALRPFWRRFFRLDWKFGLGLVLAVCIPRFVLVLRANQTGDYSSIGIIMTISALVPFLFLSREGRRKIGITSPASYRWLIYSMVAGIATSALLFAVGYVLYDQTVSNWYVYVGRSYNLPEGLGGQDKLIYFIIFATTGMVFSPVGEELFFRGIVHSSFAASVGEAKAAVIDALAFAFTHLAHFGIVYVSGVWTLLPVPAALWVIGMFAASLIFIACKKKTGSLLGAILSHAGFNLGMIYFIFYHL